MTPKKRRLLVVASVLLVLAFFSPAACQSVAGGVVDGQLAPCPGSPNCVNSEATEENSPIEPLAFEGSPEEAWSSLIAFVDALPRTDIVTSTGDYAHVVFRTKWMRFRDDVEFRLSADENVIHVRSASRAGYSDLGVNRDRIERIRAEWSQAN